MAIKTLTRGALAVSLAVSLATHVSAATITPVSGNFSLSLTNQLFDGGSGPVAEDNDSASAAPTGGDVLNGVSASLSGTTTYDYPVTSAVFPQNNANLTNSTNLNVTFSSANAGSVDFGYGFNAFEVANGATGANGLFRYDFTLDQATTLNYSLTDMVTTFFSTRGLPESSAALGHLRISAPGTDLFFDYGTDQTGSFLLGPGASFLELTFSPGQSGGISGNPASTNNTALGGSFAGTFNFDIEAAAVPLPAAGWLLLTAVGGLGVMRRRRARAA